MSFSINESHALLIVSSVTTHCCGTNVSPHALFTSYFIKFILFCGRYVTCKGSGKHSASCSNPGWSYKDLYNALHFVTII